MIGIYKITSPTNKVYIGQSWNLEKRFSTYNKLHCKAQKKLYASLNKYGVDNHEFEVIIELNQFISQLCLDKYEQYYINFFKNENIELMNLRDGGSRGKFSEESLNKMKGKKISIETRKKISNTLKGHKHSDKTKQKISLKIKNIFSDEEYKKTINWSKQGNKGQTKDKKYPKENRPTKEDLLLLIETKSLVDISVIYNVSSVTIRNWIKDYNLIYKSKLNYNRKKKLISKDINNNIINRFESLAEASNFYKVSYDLIVWRIKNKQSINEIYLEYEIDNSNNNIA